MGKISRLLAAKENKRRYDYDKKCSHEPREEWNEDYSESCYESYVKKHGLHFCNGLAECVIACMVNQNRSQHKWSIEEVKSIVTSMVGVCAFKHKVTDADLAYLANMYYADFYPEAIENELCCIKAAIKIANDPDGYEGQAFCRWMADINAQQKYVDWKKYI